MSLDSAFDSVSTIGCTSRLNISDGNMATPISRRTASSTSSRSLNLWTTRVGRTSSPLSSNQG